ncbi:MAG: tripartite tricarboxylate transporter substrate-binding protein [Rhodospirillaceae bacterium]
MVHSERVTKMTTRTAAIAVLGALSLPIVSANADPIANFYKGKKITIIVAAGPGGNYTIYSQLLAPYWKKYTPGNPGYIIQNMGGAGGTKAANYLVNSAPQDGTYIGILESTTALNAKLRATGVKYDPAKFQYLVGVDNTLSMFTVMKSSGINSMEEAKTKQGICGATGKGSTTFVTPAMVNYFLGTKFKIISGYRGMKGVNAALEKGEVNCRAAVFASIENSRPHWIKNKMIVNLAAIGTERHPDYPNVPTLIEMTQNPDAKTILTLMSSNGIFGRAWVAPPKMPKARVAALRDAFWKAFNDKDAQAAMKARKMRYDPVRWEVQQKAVVRIGATPKRIISLMKKAIAAQN